MATSVPVPQRLLAERSLDSSGKRVTDPDDGAQKEDSEDKLKGRDHDSFLRDFPFTCNALNAQLTQNGPSCNGTGPHTPPKAIERS